MIKNWLNEKAFEAPHIEPWPCLELHFPLPSPSQDCSKPDFPYHESVHWGGDDPGPNLPWPCSSLPHPDGACVSGPQMTRFFQEHILGPLAFSLTCTSGLADFSTCHVALPLSFVAGLDQTYLPFQHLKQQRRPRWGFMESCPSALHGHLQLLLVSQDTFAPS